MMDGISKEIASQFLAIEKHYPVDMKKVKYRSVLAFSPLWGIIVTIGLNLDSSFFMTLGVLSQAANTVLAVYFYIVEIKYVKENSPPIRAA